MANHKSAIKRYKQNLKRRARNRSAKSAIWTSIKSTLKACKEKNFELANASLKNTTKLLDRAVSKGILHKKNATRRISRLTRKVNQI